MHLEKNYAIIRERWPEIADRFALPPEPQGVLFSTGTPEKTLIIDGLHLASSYDRMAEARVQASLVPDESPTAWLYGLGMGETAQVLLARPALKKLYAVPMNRAIFMTVLRHIDAGPWLADPRLSLVLPEDVDDLQSPFAACPPDLILADDKAARLRDLVFHTLDTQFVNRRHRQKAGEMEKRFWANASFLEKDGDVGELFGRHPEQKIMVAAAGPTLADHYPCIRQQHRDMPLVAVDAALLPLLRAGIVPDYVVCADSFREAVLHFFAFSLEQAQTLQKSSLVYFPVVHRDVLEKWPGRRYAAFASHPLYQQKAILDVCSKKSLFINGSVLHAAADLAVRMGAAEIYFFGADFSFVGDHTNVQGSAVDNAAPDTGRWVLNGRGQRVPSSVNLIAYLRDLENYLAGHPELVFHNGSRLGARILHTQYTETACG